MKKVLCLTALFSCGTTGAYSLYFVCMSSNFEQKVLASLNNVTTSLEDIKEQIAGVSEQVAENTVQITALTGRVDGLEGRFDKLEGRFDVLENKVDRVENHVFEIKQILPTLATKDELYGAKHEILSVLENHTGKLQILEDERYASTERFGRLERNQERVLQHLHLSHVE